MGQNDDGILICRAFAPRINILVSVSLQNLNINRGQCSNHPHKFKRYLLWEAGLLQYDTFSRYCPYRTESQRHENKICPLIPLNESRRHQSLLLVTIVLFCIMCIYDQDCCLYVVCIDVPYLVVLLLLQSGLIGPYILTHSCDGFFTGTIIPLLN